LVIDVKCGLNYGVCNSGAYFTTSWQTIHEHWIWCYYGRSITPSTKCNVADFVLLQIVGVAVQYVSTSKGELLAGKMINGFAVGGLLAVGTTYASEVFTGYILIIVPWLTLKDFSTSASRDSTWRTGIFRRRYANGWPRSRSSFCPKHKANGFSHGICYTMACWHFACDWIPAVA